VYYIINRSLRSANKARAKIVALRSLVNICDTAANDINTGLALNITDFEDAVIAAIAKREKADYIVTRNEADFANSPVSAVSPAQFLRKFYSIDTK
jgi:predicted nucleic acid-binding protein